MLRLLTAIYLVVSVSWLTGCDQSKGRLDDTGEQTAHDAGPTEQSNEPEDLQTGTTITTDDGKLVGALDQGSRRFFNIPFAKPPVGKLRWRAPEPNEPWSEPRDATARGNRCPQVDSSTAAGSDTEDCLYLNVWTPNPVLPKKLPVMVWFHGGSNRYGSAVQDLTPTIPVLGYDGRILAEHGVVVVTTNYRLGALGFLPHPALAEEGSPVGNQGLLDQRMALQWVRDNIAIFGGDPDNVTVFGQSAGSVDICYHLVSPGSAGLFQRAIMQSGSCTFPMRSPDEVDAQIAAFTDAMGCGNVPDALACLRNKPVTDLVVLPPLTDPPSTPFPGGWYYQGRSRPWIFGMVTVDGSVLPDHPRALFQAGRVAKVPVIMGTTAEEAAGDVQAGVPVKTETEYREALERTFGASTDVILEQYPVAKFASPSAALTRASTDAFFACQTQETARYLARAGLDVRAYDFDMPNPTPDPAIVKLGATHSAEIPYLFVVPAFATPEQAEVAKLMQRYWVRFATSGDPNGDNDPEWPVFTEDEEARLDIKAQTAPVTRFRSDECDFWRELNVGVRF